MTFVEELTWRDNLHQMTPDAAEHLKIAPEGGRTGYIGFDPTGPSLHVGSLATVLKLSLFQKHGHQPIFLVGGATGMIGDPSGKSKERNLLTEEAIRHNVECIRQQLEQFFDFDTSVNPARMVNNYDWFKEIGYLQFLRDVGKHLTVNYMVAKDSVKNRMETGISYTEFSYQLLQGYDFVELRKRYDCTLQMGASDQWGNITSGIELGRRMGVEDLHAITYPLVTRKDGTKFGKTAEGQSIWLDPDMTSPYQFYQFWINLGDEELPTMLKSYSSKSREEVLDLIEQSAAKPGARIGQNALAEEMTIQVHGEQELDNVQQASRILFGKAKPEDLKALPERTLSDIKGDVPSAAFKLADLSEMNATVLFTESGLLQSNSEVRRAIKNGGLRINKSQLSDMNRDVTGEDLLHGKYILLQNGKKNYLLCEFS